MKAVIYFALFIIFNFPVWAQNLSWKPVNADLGTQITQIIADKTERLIIQSEKGVFIYTNLTTAKRIDSTLPDTVTITCLAIDTNNRMFAGTEKNGVFVYDENSGNWNFISSKLSKQQICNIAISNENEIVIGDLYLSLFLYNWNDSSWKPINNGNQTESRFAFIKFNQFGDLFACRKNEIYRLKHQKTDWQQIYALGNIPYSIVQSIDCYEHNIYLSTDTSTIFVTNDSVIFWTRLFEGLGTDVNIKQVLITSKGELIALSKFKGIFYSNTDGNSFEVNNFGLTALNGLTGIVLKDDRVIISIDGKGLYLSEPPKGNPIQPGGWIVKDKYLERKVFPQGMDFIKFSNDGKKIFTTSSSEYKIFDVESGKLMKQHNFPKCESSHITSDDSTFVCNIISQGSFSVNLALYRISNDSLIANNFVMYKGYTGDIVRINLNSLWSEYFFAQKTLFTGISYTTVYQGTGTGGAAWSAGGIKKVTYGQDTSITTVINTIPVSQLAFTKDLKNSILLADIGDRSGKNYINTNLLSFCDSDFSHCNELYRFEFQSEKGGVYQPIQKFKIFNNNKLLLTFSSDQKAAYWDLGLKKKIYETDFNTKFNDFEISKNDRYLITCTSSGLYIYHIPLLNLVDSIPFNTTSDIFYRMALSPDSTSIAIASTGGMVRLYKLPIIAGIDDSPLPDKVLVENKNINLFPNPVTDFINLPDGIDDSIKIFTVQGVPVFESENHSSLDVSGLPTGIYFLKAGTRTFRFIKI